MATRRNLEIAAKLGCDPEQLQYLLANYPTPEPLMPRNWALTNTGEGTQQFWNLPLPAGLTWIAWPYPHPVSGQYGFTYGPAIPSRPDGT